MLTWRAGFGNILRSYLSSEGTTKDCARIKNGGQFTDAYQTLLVGMSSGVHSAVVDKSISKNSSTFTTTYHLQIHIYLL